MAEVCVVFNGNDYEYKINNKEQLEAFKKLYNANKELIFSSKNPFLQIENNVLGSIGNAVTPLDKKVLEKFFNTMSEVLKSCCFSVDIYNNDENKGLMLKYEAGKIVDKIEYSG